MSKLTLNKIEIAERQLVEAIKLFFEERDPVSIHTLVGTSLGILEPVAKKKGIKSFMTLVFDKINPKMLKEFWGHLYKHRNFFKHANNDASETIAFNTDINCLKIYQAIELFEQLSSKNVLELNIFKGYFVAKNPHLFEEPQKGNIIETINTIKGLNIDLNDFEYYRLAIFDNECRKMALNTFPKAIKERINA